MKNPKENSLQLILIFLGLGSSYWISLLAAKEDLAFWVIPLIIIAISIIVWFVSNLINERILRINEEAIRGQYEFEENIKGLWIERYSIDGGGVGYGLIEVIYNEPSNNLHLKGFVYNSGGEKFANWSSKSVYTDRNKKSVFYIYEGEFMDSRLKGNGYGKLDFSHSNGDIISSGIGCFEDYITKYIPKTFDIDRVDNGLCEELIGQKIPKQSLDKKLLIIKYHEHIEQKINNEGNLNGKEQENTQII